MSIFKELLVDVFSFHWELGSVSISIGGILSFLLILMVTFFISRIIASLLKDEWAIRSLPKGSSSGTSMVLRIIVVCVGFYLALTSAGIDLGKVGFIIGGLGVGIGFGLQNVVLNFIAGLILAFERPIIVGDVIMADMEKGVVSNIGVRASKIKRYDGSEVIIPNGDLISKKVTNYTLSDSKRRSLITVRTSVYADPNEVIDILTGAATSDERTLKDPMPKTYFKGYGDSSLDFHLLYWTYFEDTFEADSAIAINIYNLLKVKGIHLPIPRISIENEKEKT
jgi:small-conductance mechanosensitive channel